MNWILFNSGPCPAAFNMAMDEALLEAMPRLGKPVLRSYGWTQPAATFGYFQKFAEVERATLLRPLVRRPTGGGIVPHDADWTYSLTFPTGHEWYALRAEESYRRVHEWIQTAFTRLNVSTELAPCCKKNLPDIRSSRREEALTKKSELEVSLVTSAATINLHGQCFVGHEKSDLLRQGQKIAGAAQRRNKLGLLIQGSVQPQLLKQSRADWERAMCEAASTDGGASWQEIQLNDELKQRAEQLTYEKYSQPAYNQRR